MKNLDTRLVRHIPVFVSRRFTPTLDGIHDCMYRHEWCCDPCLRFGPSGNTPIFPRLTRLQARRVEGVSLRLLGNSCTCMYGCMCRKRVDICFIA